MTDDTPTSTVPAWEDTPGAAASAAPGAGGSSVQDRAAAIVNERPEVAVGAAFGGGLLIGLILKRLAS
ncbi:MAG TPA: hypothetical protein VJU80_06475 [Solirubrobacteraceae bacterium]|nr:hypothetical protein [Solirubrobacteraceae bacterium]